MCSVHNFVMVQNGLGTGDFRDSGSDLIHQSLFFHEPKHKNTNSPKHKQTEQILEPTQQDRSGHLDLETFVVVIQSALEEKCFAILRKNRKNR